VKIEQTPTLEQSTLPKKNVYGENLNFSSNDKWRRYGRLKKSKRRLACLSMILPRSRSAYKLPLPSLLRRKVEDAPKVVFGQEEDEDTVIKKRRGPLIELDFAMDKEKAAEKLETIRTQVTKDKDTLWKAKVRWEAISDVSSKLVMWK
jgi:hypothetical protein